jgi:CHAD domain-containing protein
MAFRLKRRGGMPTQLRRIVRGELRKALDALDEDAPGEDAVHEARKCVKKARAVLRLLRAPLGSRYAAENDRLRGVARALASLRDADATLDTLRALHARYPGVVSATTVRAVGRGLQRRKRRVKATIDPVVKRAHAALVRSCRSAPPRLRQVAGFRATRAGAVEGYREAHDACRALALDSDATAFHEWRKRIKDHWYHVRLFAGLPDGPRSRVRSLERLEGWLGEDHDLATLRSIVLEGDDRYGDARTRTLVLGAIVKSQASLRRRALALGHRAFSQSPREFRVLVTRWWRR